MQSSFNKRLFVWIKLFILQKTMYHTNVFELRFHGTAFYLHSSSNAVLSCERKSRITNKTVTLFIIFPVKCAHIIPRGCSLFHTVIVQYVAILRGRKSYQEFVSCEDSIYQESRCGEHRNLQHSTSNGRFNKTSQCHASSLKEPTHCNNQTKKLKLISNLGIA